MTLTLHLGVAVLPYGNDTARTQRRVAKARPGKQKPRPARAASSGSQTTGDVATILEKKYGVMAYFFQQHQAEIAGALEQSLAGTLENIMLGAPPKNNPFGAAEIKIEDAFKLFLDRQEMAGHVNGVPTKAALRGVNHRLRHPYAKSNSARPSFIDTGLYQGSFKAWVD